jgi:hypothetical protein
MTLQRFHQLSPETVLPLGKCYFCIEHWFVHFSYIPGDKLRRSLCDKDPSVMGAALCVLYDMAKNDPTAYKDLVPSYVSILKQITEVSGVGVRLDGHIRLIVIIIISIDCHASLITIEFQLLGFRSVLIFSKSGFWHSHC